MSLTAADVAEIMRLVEQSNFDELILEMDGIKLCLRRGAPEQSQPQKAPGIADTTAADTTADTTDAGPAAVAGPAAAAWPAATAAAPANASGPAASHVTNTVVASADPNVHEVTSPLLGTFYRAPKPGAAPFVEVGSQVEEETVVAIIEVMKLMNTVRAGARGTVTEILVADGALAEYGETLLRVSKAG